MPEAARITIPVTTNARQAAKDVDVLNTSVKDQGKESSRAAAGTDKLSKSLKNMTRLLGVAAVVAFTKKIIKMGSDAEETANKFNVVFKDVPEQAAAAAENLATNFAFAKDEAQKLLSDTGDLLTGFGFAGDEALEMSEKVNTLAADLASFTNIEGGAERASKALTSALFGEREAAKQLGIVIRDQDIMARLAAKGMDKLTGTALLQAKAMATLAIATEQSENARGDFARSSDSFANVSRRLVANIKDLAVEAGQSALPHFKELAKTFVLATEKGGFLSRVAITLGKVLGTIADVVAQTVGILDVLAKSSALKDTVKDSESLRFSTNRLNDVGAVLLKTYGRGSKEFIAWQEAAKKMTAQIGDNNSKLEGQNKSLSATGEALKKARDRLLGYDEELKKNAETQNKLAGDVKAGANATKLSKEEQEKLNKARMAALAILAKQGSGTDALTAKLASLRVQQAEQTKMVEAAGLSAASMDLFYQKQRETALKQFLQKSIADESLTYDQRKNLLQSNYDAVLAAEALSYEDRLAAQQAYTESSNLLEQQRMQTIADGVNDFARFGNEVIGIGSAFAKLRVAQGQKEIEAMKKRGASEEEIAKKQKELQIQAAKDQKKIQLASATINVAQGVTQALAAYAPPASWILAGLTAAKGAIEIAAIAATPIPTAQFGGNFVVPPGAEADSGLLRVNSGEQVNVQPTRESGGGGQDFGTLMIDGQPFKAYVLDTVQRGFNDGKLQIRRQGAIKVA
jgi:hypothetical protein